MVYIKDMKKPENCYDCPCYNDEYGKCQIEGNWYKGYVYDATPDWCPLIPVPDHGRLIDADALEEAFCGNCFADEKPMECSEPCIDMRIVLEAPTIIPADKEADNG